MSNPLLKAFGAMANQNNPLMNMITGISNPQTMLNTLMSNLQKQNPQGYAQIQQMMNSGQNPENILNTVMANRNPVQKEQMRQMMSQFGMPQEYIDKIK